MATERFEFGKYEVLEELGRGAMGVVYRARERELDREVALKMILSSRLATPRAVERFVAEAHAAAQATHPGVVRIYDAGVHNGQRFIAMECITGESFAARLERGRLELHESAAILCQVARAVHHLHGLGIVHRDLKPSNVMLAEPDARPCLMDFGLAKVSGRDRESSELAVVGTPGYMAPEQLGVEAAKVGPQVDVYALGVMLYEAVTGARPFDGETTEDVLIRSLEGRFAAPRAVDRSVPRELESIILRAMEKSPARRYPNAAELADDLDRFLAGEPVAAGGRGALSELRRVASRHVALVARLCAFVSFFLVACLNAALGFVEGGFLVELGVTLSVWSGVCIALDRVVHRSGLWPRVWSLVDAAMLTRIAWLLDGVQSSLVLVYPLLIVSVGLWARVRLVWFAVAANLAGYAALVLDSELSRTALKRPADQHIVFVAVIVATAVMTGVQIRRHEAVRRLYTGR